MNTKREVGGLVDGKALRLLTEAVRLHQAGMWVEAERAYRELLAVRNGHAEARNRLGVLLLQTGRFEEAIVELVEVVRQGSGEGASWSNLGAALMRVGRIGGEGGAVSAYRRAVALLPGNVEVIYNLGHGLMSLGEWREAAGCFEVVGRSRPDLVLAKLNRAGCLARLGEVEAGVGLLRELLAADPRNVAATNNLGVLLGELGRFEEAKACFERAVALDGGYADAWSNLAAQALARQVPEEAERFARRAVELAPGHGEAWNVLGQALRDRGRLEDALGAYRRSLEVRKSAEVHSNMLLAMHSVPEIGGAELRAAHRQWGEVHLACGGRRTEREVWRDTGRPVRIGYLSPDFREHSVSYFMEAVLRGHDRGRFEVLCYSDVRAADGVTRALAGVVGEGWREVGGEGDWALMERFRRDGVEILVDLAGHTGRNRLRVFDRTLDGGMGGGGRGRLQVSYLGYMNTTGVPDMDARVMDRVTGVNEGDGGDRGEEGDRLLVLPEVFACYTAPGVARGMEVSWKGEAGRLVLGSFHVGGKLNLRLMRRWARVMREVPGAVLRMVGVGAGSVVGEVMAAEGVGAERLELRGRVSLAEYFELMRGVDLMLDCDPCSGHTVGCHGMWMGVPVVTLAGRRHHERMVASAVMAAGYGEDVVETEDGYVTRVVAIAREAMAGRGRGSGEREARRERMLASALCDGRRFMAHYEGALLGELKRGV